MLVQSIRESPQSAHVVVLGNEKGGSGKSTTAMHIAVALLKAGQRVATIDLDSAAEKLHPLHRKSPRLGRARPHQARTAVHFVVDRADGARSKPTRRRNSPTSRPRSARSSSSHDFVIIDTPGTDSYLMRLAHSMADTLVTPLNDSFVDFDVLGTLDPTNFDVTGESHYAEMVREARRQRRLVDGGLTDWVVVRNRLSALGSRNKRLVGEGIDELVQAHSAFAPSTASPSGWSIANSSRAD